MTRSRRNFPKQAAAGGALPSLIAEPSAAAQPGGSAARRPANLLVDLDAPHKPCVSTARCTLVVNRRRDKHKTVDYQLYDNLADPQQMRNVVAANMPLVNHPIDGEITPWLERTADPWRPAPFDSSAPTAQQACRMPDGTTSNLGAQGHP
jgi:hypothetical protein